MSKRELIDIISKVNPKATRDFLVEFSERELNDYLRQLTRLGIASTKYDAGGRGSASDVACAPVD